ncbi:MAG: hypothetical protein H6837_04925 [Planctomycetes bacterium]|nr:hypothetical protein [Planctomycetota bacterium]
MSKSSLCRITVPAVSCAVASIFTVLTTSLPAQGRGRRGPPEAVRQRWGNYFAPVKLAAADQGKPDRDRMADSEHVKGAAGKHHLSLLYVFDSSADKDKQQSFEQVVMNNGKINSGLRLFRCGSVDLAGDDAAKKEFGGRAPLFITFDESGKRAAEASFKGFHVTPVKLVQAMRKAASGYGKLGFDGFVKGYTKLLHDLTLIDTRRQALATKRTRLEKKPNAKALDGVVKDEAALRKQENELLDAERKMLSLAKVPERDPAAKLVGEPRRGRG